MGIRIGINGFGRIGRNYLRCALERRQSVAAINDVTGPATLAHLLKYDSTYGPLDRKVDSDGSALFVGGTAIAVSTQRDPAALDWGAFGVDLVIESTGRFRDRAEAARHLKAGARKVVLSAAASRRWPMSCRRRSASNVFRYTTDPIVSRDVVGQAASCVFDASLTQAAGELATCFGWYDNEWGYVNRLADLVEYIDDDFGKFYQQIDGASAASCPDHAVDVNRERPCPTSGPGADHPDRARGELQRGGGDRARPVAAEHAQEVVGAGLAPGWSRLRRGRSISGGCCVQGGCVTCREAVPRAGAAAPARPGGSAPSAGPGLVEHLKGGVTWLASCSWRRCR